MYSEEGEDKGTDRLDAEVAKEMWEKHLKRNKSVIVDLFQGRLIKQTFIIIN